MRIYHPLGIDTRYGGFYQHFCDDGRVYDLFTPHLVGSPRFVFNYAMASVLFENPEYKCLAEHGLAFLHQAHRQPDTQGYAWTLRYRKPGDRTNHCSGLSFVLLAYAVALMARRRGTDRPARAWAWQEFRRVRWSPERRRRWRSGRRQPAVPRPQMRRCRSARPRAAQP